METNRKLRNFYEILGVGRNASDKDIKKAYRNQMKKYHPDHWSEVSETEKPYWSKRYQDAQDAYNVLKNKNNREAYNAKYDQVYGKSSQTHQSASKDRKGQSSTSTVTEAEARKAAQEERIAQAKIAEYNRQIAEQKEYKKRAMALYKQEKKALDKSNNKGKRNTMGGKLLKPFKLLELPGHKGKKPTNRRFKIRLIAGFCAGVLLGSGIAYFLTRDKNKDTNKTNTDSYTQNSGIFNYGTQAGNEIKTEIDNLVETIETNSKTVYENWNQFSEVYTQDDIKEMIKCINGYDSKVTIDQVDTAIIEILNKAVEPAINSAMVGNLSYSYPTVDIASMLINDQAYAVVKAMQDNLNGTLSDPSNMAFYVNNAFLDEAIVADLKNPVGKTEECEGFGLDYSSAGSRLLWSRLTIFANAMAGTLGPDYSVNVMGKDYTQNDLNNSDIYENIAKSAKEAIYGGKIKTFTFSK